MGAQRETPAAKCRYPYDDGEPVQEIATLIGRSSGFVKRSIEEAGGTSRSTTNQPKRTTVHRHELAARLRRRYGQGASTKDLATWKVGSTSYVRTLVHEAGEDDASARPGLTSGPGSPPPDATQPKRRRPVTGSVRAGEGCGHGKLEAVDRGRRSRHCPHRSRHDRPHA
ncbi:helix-turn-helix domain-containing protein [Umezawaea sp. Da 62-37]|uniref:helix-turn-helix domain-containing protein n=1 Tax=Umezawaea sp. Da 62-37 TaxID=3075927 RepID=UPI0037DDA247